MSSQESKMLGYGYANSITKTNASSALSVATERVNPWNGKNKPAPKEPVGETVIESPANSSPEET